MRWKHTDRGLLLPGEFLPLAEKTGLILSLGDLVLEAALASLPHGPASPELADITIAVNISARQFRQPDFVKRVLDTLDRSGAKPGNIELELTESSLVDDVDLVVTRMSMLKAHGLRFSVDDFGLAILRCPTSSGSHWTS